MASIEKTMRSEEIIQTLSVEDISEFKTDNKNNSGIGFKFSTN